MHSRNMLVAVITLASVACNSKPQWTVTDIVAREGTVVDLHGNVGISALPAACQPPTPALPIPPLDWWNGLPAQQRGGAVVGYQVWKDENPAHNPVTCPGFQT